MTPPRHPDTGRSADFGRDVRAAIPAIRWGIDTFFAGNPQANSFIAACRQARTIAATAAASGPQPLATAAGYLDAALQALRLGRLEASEVTRVVVHHNVDLLQTSIEDSVQQAQLASELDLTYHALQQHLRRTAVAPRRADTAPLPNLEAAFTMEAEGHVTALGAVLELLETNPQHEPGWAALQRRGLRLQSAAAMMGRPDIVRILQNMADLAAQPNGGAARGQQLDLLFQSVDALSVLVRRPAVDEVALQICEAVLALYEVTLDNRAAPASGAVMAPAPALEETRLRISLGELEALLSQLDDLAAPARDAARSLAAARDTTDEAARQAHLAAAAAAQQRQESMRLALRRRIQQLQLLPFERLTERLRRAVQRTAGSLNRPVALTFRDAAIAADAPTVQVLIAALEHLLPATVEHGIEDAAARRSAGKPLEAQIDVLVRQQAGQLTIEVRDDGHGIDLIGPGSGPEVALQALAPHRGTVAVESTPGLGTCVTLRLPAAMIAAPLLKLRSGQDSYALPQAGVQVGRLLPGMLHWRNGRRTVVHEGRPITAVALSTLLDPGAAQPGPVGVYVVLADDKAQRALLVEEAIASNPLPLQPPGPDLGTLPFVAGVVLTEEGGVLPVLDPALLLQAPNPDLSIAQAAPLADPLRVLVVDDSLSVRHINAATLRQAGWEPLVARDGAEALALLAGANQRVDVALVDIDLPETDGFDLAQVLRRRPGGTDLPIIFLSAADNPVRRRRADALQGSAFLAKPYPEQELLALIQRVMPQRRHIAAD